MSGIDEYTRFHWSIDSSEDAWLSQAFFDGSQWLSYNYDTGAYDLPNNHDDYPHPNIGSYDGKIGLYSPGKFGDGIHFYSQTQSSVISYYRVEDAYNPHAMPGFSALITGDYTIDFWIKVTGSGFQPILYHSGTFYQITYNDGILLVSIGGNQNKLGCSCNLTGSFHHVEINRSDGHNRIFIDGVWQPLLYDDWIPLSSYIDPSGWCFGCQWYNLTDVDYVLDEIRLTSGIARHVVNFDVPTEPYTRVFPATEITSPTDGEIIFISDLELGYTLVPKSTTLAIMNGEILFKQPVDLQVTFPERETVPAIQDGRIRFELLFDLDSGFYGITVPAIQDGEITFDAVLESSLDLQGYLLSVTQIVNQVYEITPLPATLTAELAVDLILYRVFSPPTTYQITFWNALELGWQFIVLNALEYKVSGSIEFVNQSTVKISFELNITNKILAKNEVTKSLTLYNRLLDSVLISNYSGFYFSKIHGAE